MSVSETPRSLLRKDVLKRFTDLTKHPAPEVKKFVAGSPARLLQGLPRPPGQRN